MPSHVYSIKLKNIPSVRMSEQGGLPSEQVFANSNIAPASSGSQQSAHKNSVGNHASDINLPYWARAIERHEETDGRSQPWKKAVGSMVEDRHYLGYREWNSEASGTDFAGKCTECGGKGCRFCT
ncbi:hypothetical protein CH063_00424, partial [Colletotrichum higginsianum]